ncbi:MAG: hypothetical protein ACI978_002300 [Oleispira sp.]|jgi:hypothetical protein
MMQGWADYFTTLNSLPVIDKKSLERHMPKAAKVAKANVSRPKESSKSDKKPLLITKEALERNLY